MDVPGMRAAAARDDKLALLFGINHIMDAWQDRKDRQQREADRREDREWTREQRAIQRLDRQYILEQREQAAEDRQRRIERQDAADARQVRLDQERAQDRAETKARLARQEERQTRQDARQTARDNAWKEDRAHTLGERKRTEEERHGNLQLLKAKRSLREQANAFEAQDGYDGLSKAEVEQWWKNTIEDVGAEFLEGFEKHRNEFEYEGGVLGATPVRAKADLERREAEADTLYTLGEAIEAATDAKSEYAKAIASGDPARGELAFEALQHSAEDLRRAQEIAGGIRGVSAEARANIELDIMKDLNEVVLDAVLERSTRGEGMTLTELQGHIDNGTDTFGFGDVRLTANLHPQVVADKMSDAHLRAEGYRQREDAAHRRTDAERTRTGDKLVREAEERLAFSDDPLGDVAEEAAELAKAGYHGRARQLRADAKADHEWNQSAAAIEVHNSAEAQGHVADSFRAIWSADSVDAVLGHKDTLLSLKQARSISDRQFKEETLRADNRIRALEAEEASGNRFGTEYRRIMRPVLQKWGAMPETMSSAVDLENRLDMGVEAIGIAEHLEDIVLANSQSTQEAQLAARVLDATMALRWGDAGISMAMNDEERATAQQAAITRAAGVYRAFFVDKAERPATDRETAGILLGPEYMALLPPGEGGIPDPATLVEHLATRLKDGESVDQYWFRFEAVRELDASLRNGAPSVQVESELGDVLRTLNGVGAAEAAAMLSPPPPGEMVPTTPTPAPGGTIQQMAGDAFP